MAEHGRHILEAATPSRGWFKQRCRCSLEGSNAMQLELKRLRREAAELASDVAAESQATQHRMERERFTEPY